MHFFIADIPVPDYDGVRVGSQRVYIKCETHNISLSDVKAVVERMHDRDKDSKLYDNCWQKCLDSLAAAEGDIRLYPGVASINTFTRVKLARGLVSEQRCPLSITHIDFESKTSTTQVMKAAACSNPSCDSYSCPTHGV